MCFTRKKLLCFLFATIALNCFANNTKRPTWCEIKPLERYPTGVISIVNTDSMNRAFILPVSAGKQLIFFFSFGQNEYKLPLSDKSNERIIVAVFDPKTRNVGEGICLEVPSNWKSYVHVSPHAVTLFTVDKKKGNSCVFYDIENNTFTPINIGDLDCRKGSLSYKADSPPDYSYYYFWDPTTKELCSVSLASKSLKKSGITIGEPYFYDANEAWGKKNERKVIVADTEDTYEKDGKELFKTRYMCVSGLFIEYEPLF